ncbi:MAG: hypothetical protein ABI603_01280 [Acidobacteriota bacterium]
MKVTFAIVAAISVMSFAPVEAQEQEPSPSIASFDVLPQKLRPGQSVYVTDALMRETKGRLVRVSDTSITLLVQQAEREFPRPDVQQIARAGDSVANGMAIGMGAFGAWALAIDVAGDCFDAFCMAMSGTMVGIGAGIGALIDYAIKGKTVVYRAKKENVTATPVLIGSRGLGIAVRF